MNQNVPLTIADKAEASFATVIHVCALLRARPFVAKMCRNIPLATYDGRQVRRP